MPLIYLIILAVIQGITEFLPISSSGHLQIFWEVYGGNMGAFGADEGQQLVIDVFLHFGTLLAVLVYFWRDLLGMLGGVMGMFRGGKVSEWGSNVRLVGYLILATLPAMFCGLMISIFWADIGRNMEVIAYMSIIFGIFLFAADYFLPHKKNLEKMTWKSALLIGLAQALALIPGVSRSGITMTAARGLSFSRKSAAKFSLLLGIPTVAGAVVLNGISLAKADNAALTSEALLGCFIAFIIAYIVIAIMMRWIERMSFLPFAIYRVVMGVGILLWLGVYL